MNNSYEMLFKSIRAKCQQNNWFGPDLLSPKHYEGVVIYDDSFDFISPPDDREPIAVTTFVSVDAPNRFGFILPPASEALLQQTEERLGFPLPPLLRALYAHVANGGFGPGTGLKGIPEGYGKKGYPYSNDNDTIVDQYLWRGYASTFDLTQIEKPEQQKYSNLEVPYGVWPKQLLPICDMGCAQEACLASDERMFVATPIASNERYGLSQLPWTFEEWLWRWVHDEELLDRNVDADSLPPIQVAS